MAVKMLSAPHIIAADNREAHILVGESIPILTSTVTNVLTDNNGSAVNSVQYRDTGKIPVRRNAEDCFRSRNRTADSTPAVSVSILQNGVHGVAVSKENRGHWSRH